MQTALLRKYERLVIHEGDTLVKVNRDDAMTALKAACWINVLHIGIESFCPLRILENEESKPFG